MINHVISRYKILKKIGQGGMGEVYLAEDTELGRQVALKFLPAHYLQDPEINTRFKREAKAAASLSHPNLITIYDVGEHETKPYIAMEYIPGYSLRELLAREELSINKIIDIACQICEGLTTAHQKGIFHRDIKPDNILIDETGRVKIADFGLAKERGKTKVTKTGSTLGTLEYMSPEQLSSGEVDNRSDIWSVGIMLYEMITGRLPFSGDYDASVSYAIVNEKVEPLARYKTGVSDAFQQIIDKALDKDKETRYQNITDLLTDLKREKKSSVMQKPAYRENRKLRFSAISIVALSIFAIISIIIAGYFISKKTTKHLPTQHRQITFDGNVYTTDRGSGRKNLSSLSPDGQFLAYAIKKGNTYSVMLIDLSGGQPIEIQKDLDFIFNIRWSPDGSRLLLCGSLTNKDRDHNPQSLIIPRFGGKPQILPFNPYVSWSPDGSQIAGTWQAGPWTNTHPVYFFDTTTGDTTNIIQLEGFNFFLDIDWNPNGKWLAFLTCNGNASRYSIWTVLADGSNQQKIVESEKPLFTPLWSRNGEALYFLQKNGLTCELLKIDISVKNGGPLDEPEVIQTGMQAEGFSLARNRNIISFTNSVSYGNLWLYSIQEEQGTSSLKSKQLTRGTSKYYNPVISPDGKKVAFINQGKIYLMSTEGGDTTPLTFLDSEIDCLCWSASGEELAFISDEKVWRIPAKGGTPTQLSETKASGQISWAPGKKILFSIPGNQNYHNLDPVNGYEKSLVADDSAGWIFSCRIAPVEQIVAVAWNRMESGEILAKQKIWLISLEDSSEKCLQDPYDPDNWYPLQWSNDGSWIYAFKRKNQQNIIKVPVNGDKPIHYISLPFEDLYTESGLPSDAISVTADGKKIICSVKESISDIWIMENFDPVIE